MPVPDSVDNLVVDDDDKSIQLAQDRRNRFGVSLFSLGDAVIVTDSLGKVILLNPAAESLTGWTEADARDQPIESIFRIIHEVTRLPVVQPVKKVMEYGKTHNLAQLTLLIAKDGAEMAIDDSASPIFDAGGGIEGVVLVFRDVSERREVEKDLETSRLHSEVIIATVQDSLIVLDSELRVRSANRSFYETFQTSPEETIGRSFFDLGDGQWKIDGLQNSLREIVDRNTTFDDFQVEQPFLSLGPRIMRLNARKLRRKDGMEGMILLAIEDITQRRRIGLSLAASELRFRRLFEAAQDGILILDGFTGAITDANPFLLDLLGYQYDEMVGKYLFEIGLLGDEGASRAAFQELQEKGYIRYEDLPLKTSDGQSADVEFVCNVYREGESRVIQCNIRDITARKIAEEELRRAKEAAEEADRTKGLFLAKLSHELRTPLTPVLATIAYLESMADVSEALKVEFASIRRNVELEARLIDDLLDVTKIGQGKLDLHREVLDIHVAIRAALEICQSEIEAKKLEVSLALRAEGRLVWADPARLQQVFWNLIKNAVKFTPIGGSISIRSADAGIARLSIEVADTGAGIDEVILPRIFDVFEQGDREVTRQYGGLGLGLAIAKMLVDLHGGSLTVASKGAGLGSVFRIELDQIPKPKEQEPRPKLIPGHAAEALKILLVDDNPDTLRAVGQLLRSSGFDVRGAGSVGEALAALGIEQFNLLVSDIGLPDGSGLEIMSYGRDVFGLKGIAFSGYGTAEDVTESRKAGFAHHLAKPSSLNVLVDLIRRTAS